MIDDETPPVLRDITPNIAYTRLQDVVIPIPPRLPAAEQSRTSWLWANARYLAQRAVQRADALDALQSGEARKRFAVLKLRQGLDELRRRARTMLPAPLVSITFAALDRAAPWLVEQAFRHLSRWAGGR